MTRRRLGKIRKLLFDGLDVEVIDRSVEKVVVELGNDCRRNVVGSLTGDGEEHAEFSTLFNDFLECLQTIVAPCFAFSNGVNRKDCVSFVDDQV